MKTLLILVIVSSFGSLWSQNRDTLTATTAQVVDSNWYDIQLDNGRHLTGQILYMDAQVALVRTENGRIIQYDAKEIVNAMVLLDSQTGFQGEWIGEERFATRYFIGTNALPIRKGEHYSLIHLFGPEAQFGVGKDLGIGLMTSWIGVPIVANFKKSWGLCPKVRFAIGGIGGTMSWVNWNVNGLLPFASLTIGERTRNFSLSVGHASLWTVANRENRLISNFSAMAKVTKKVSLVVETFLIGYDRLYSQSQGKYFSKKEDRATVFIYGFRFHQEEGQAFQVGFVQLNVLGGTLPIPMLQWYRNI